MWGREAYPQFQHVRLLLGELFVFLVSRQPFDSLFQRMFQNVSIPKGRCARKEKSQRQFSYANHITLFSLIPPEHCKLSVQNLQREKEKKKKTHETFFLRSIYQHLNVIKLWQRELCDILTGSVIIKTPDRLWLSYEVFYRYFICFNIEMVSHMKTLGLLGFIKDVNCDFLLGCCMILRNDELIL